MAVTRDPDRVVGVDADGVAALDPVETSRAQRRRVDERTAAPPRRVPRRITRAVADAHLAVVDDVPPPRARPGVAVPAAASAAAGSRSAGGARGPGSGSSALEQAGVELTGADVVALEQRAQEAALVRDAEQVEARRARGRVGDRALARSGPWAITLASIGSYAVPISLPASTPRVDAHALERRLAVERDRPGRGQEAAAGSSA